MTPEQEDALYEAFDNDRHAVIGTRGAFLVAIRAAVAAERERCAKVCIKWGDDQVVKWDHDDEMREYNKSRAWDALQCAAAIRRG